MLYITSLVLIYLRNLYILIIFVYCPPTPASDNHTFGLFFYDLYACFWHIMDIQHHVSFGYTKSWFFFSISFQNDHSAQFSCSVVSDSLRPHGLQYTRLPCPSPTPGSYSNSCPSPQWSHSTISSSVVPFSSHLQSSPASGSFPMSGSSHQVAKVLEFQL